MEPQLNMTQNQKELYERICTFRFDEGGTAFPFAARLARDNGWSRGYTARVITEYRRFAFLAVAAGHPVSPSDQVDQAWHLHLLYTRSYWQHFCGELLNTLLHHEPTQGGCQERDKFYGWYERTLESYGRVFGQEPPADIWRNAEVRFGDDIHFERVNTKCSWIIPKPWAKGGSS